MTLATLIADFTQPYLDLLPRVAHRPPSNEWMVVDSAIRGPRVRASPVLYVPSLTHIEYYPSHEVPIDCALQRLTTADGETVIFNVSVMVQVINPVLLRETLGQEEWEESVSLIIREDVCYMVTGHNMSYLSEVFDDERYNPPCLDEYGLRITRFLVEDFQRVRAITIIQ